MTLNEEASEIGARKGNGDFFASSDPMDYIQYCVSL